jgi:hypothetical protein
VFYHGQKPEFRIHQPIFHKNVGISPDELLHKNIGETLYKSFENVPESRNGVTSALLDGKNWQGELLTISKNGTRTGPTPLQHHSATKTEKLMVYVIQQDITEKKKSKPN